MNLQSRAKEFVSDFEKTETRRYHTKITLIITGFLITFVVVSFAASWAERRAVTNINTHIDCIVNSFTAKNQQEYQIELAKCKELR